MDTKELVKEKKQLESDILSLIVEFQERTEFLPNNILIHRVRMQEMNAVEEQALLAGVTVEITL